MAPFRSELLFDPLFLSKHGRFDLRLSFFIRFHHHCPSSRNPYPICQRLGQRLGSSLQSGTDLADFHQTMAHAWHPGHHYFQRNDPGLLSCLARWIRSVFLPMQAGINVSLTVVFHIILCVMIRARVSNTRSDLIQQN